MSNSNYGADWERELQGQGFLDAGRLIQASPEIKLTFTFGRQGHVREFTATEWDIEIANPFMHVTAKEGPPHEKFTLLLDDLMEMSWTKL
jgi:hypothetical protein